MWQRGQWESTERKTKCHFLHMLLGFWTNHYCTGAQITRSSIMAGNLKCPNTVAALKKATGTLFLTCRVVFSVERGLTSTVDVFRCMRACDVEWYFWKFLLQEGIMGSPCKHEATHRGSQMVIKEYMLICFEGQAQSSVFICISKWTKEVLFSCLLTCQEEECMNLWQYFNHCLCVTLGITTLACWSISWSRLKCLNNW